MALFALVDCNNFYASCERVFQPELRGKPVVVLSNNDGCVIARSNEAKALGIPMGEAWHLCRERGPTEGVIVRSSNYTLYGDMSARVMKILADFTPDLEVYSIDEAFLDVAGLRRIAGTPPEIAGRLRRAVAERVGLQITVGVARTKFLAKVASGVAKPDGLLVVEPHLELEFLHPLPVGRLWGVGPVTERKLRDRGILTVGDVAALGESHLTAMLGVGSGRHLHALAHNHDPRPIETGKRRGSIGSQQALGRGAKSPAVVEALLLGIVDRVTRRMRSAGRLGRTVTLRFRYDDFRRATRARSLAHPTAATDPIQSLALSVLRAEQATIERRGLTLIGLSVGGLVDRSDGAEQLLLPFGRSTASALDGVVDDLRERFGHAALTRASLIGERNGFEVPKLPD